MPNMSEFLSTTEAAALCGVSPETIRRWIRTKGLPAFNTELGLNIRIRVADLHAFAGQHHIYLAGAPALEREAPEPGSAWNELA